MSLNFYKIRWLVYFDAIIIWLVHFDAMKWYENELISNFSKI
jgi:hypothetical protein